MVGVAKSSPSEGLVMEVVRRLGQRVEGFGRKFKRRRGPRRVKIQLGQGTKDRLDKQGPGLRKKGDIERIGVAPVIRYYADRIANAGHGSAVYVVDDKATGKPVPSPRVPTWLDAGKLPTLYIPIKPVKPGSSPVEVRFYKEDEDTYLKLEGIASSNNETVSKLLARCLRVCAFDRVGFERKVGKVRKREIRDTCRECEFF